MNSAMEFFNLWAEQARDFAWSMFWQSSLLIGLLYGIEYLLRSKLRAAVRYALWLIVLVKLLLPPSLALPSGIGWWIPQSPPAPAFRQSAVSRVPDQPASQDFPPAQNSLLPSAPPRTPLSPAAWGLTVSILISFGLLVWMGLCWRRAARLMREARPAPEWLGELLEQTRQNAGLRRSVELRLIDRAVSPAICGLIHPVILAPQSLVEQLPAGRIRSILLHELIHFQRGDLWINCLQTFLQVVYWWNPFLWLANHQIRRIREEAVDDAVMVALREDADAYAPTLLQVARLTLHRPWGSLGTLGILESRAWLRQRIERLIDFHAPCKAGLTCTPAFCIVVFAAAILPMGQAPIRASMAASSLDSQARSGIETSPVPSPKSESKASQGQNARVAALVKKAQQFYEERNIEEFEKVLLEIEKLDPANSEAAYYRNLIREYHDFLRQVTGWAGGTNSPGSSKGQQMLLSKLDRIRFKQVQFNHLPLPKVIQYLDGEARTLDPEKQGVNFILNYRVKGAPGSAPDQTADLDSVLINMPAPLQNVRLADVLDAIVRAADAPIAYSIEEYAIVFIHAPELYTRAFQVDPSTFIRDLEDATGDRRAVPPVGGPQNYARVIRSYFQGKGIDIDPSRFNFYYNDTQGLLYVRASLADLKKIETVLQAPTNGRKSNMKQ